MLVAHQIALLFPLGIWLIQSSATGRNQQSQFAAAGTIAFMISLLAFVCVGFGFMFGGIGLVLNSTEFQPFVSVVNVPFSDQFWGLLGMHGFLLDSSSQASLELLFAFAPLVVTATMILVSALITRTSMAIIALAAAIMGAIGFPVVGFWIWGGGWLASLGVNLNLGHGAVDLSGISTAATVAGTAGICWSLLRYRSEKTYSAPVHDSIHPLRSLVGIVFMIIGAGMMMNKVQLFSSKVDLSFEQYVINIFLASSIAGSIALAYSTFAVHRPDMLMTGRAVLAAVILISSGAVLYSPVVCILLGLAAGILALIGNYLITTLLHIRDDVGIASTSFLAGCVGLLSVGIFADGSFGAGWNGVGLASYLGIDALGISGIMPFTSGISDLGQLTAQVTAVLATVSLSICVFSILAQVGARFTIPSYAGDIISLQQPTAPVRSLSVDIAAESAQLPVTSYIATPETIPVIETPIAQPSHIESGSKVIRANTMTLLQRLRKARDAGSPTTVPIQARHVAYPIRAGGRRVLQRPVSREKNDQANSEEPRKRGQ